MMPNVDERDLWTKQKNLEVKSENFWAKLRVKCDKHGIQYYDVLAGERCKESHIHTGYTLKGDEKFRRSREQIVSLSRKIKSQMHGEYPAEKIVLKKSPEKCRIVFSVTPVGPTRESTVGIFELEEP